MFEITHAKYLSCLSCCCCCFLPLPSSFSLLSLLLILNPKLSKDDYSVCVMFLDGLKNVNQLQRKSDRVSALDGPHRSRHLATGSLQDAVWPCLTCFETPAVPLYKATAEPASRPLGLFMGHPGPGSSNKKGFFWVLLLQEFTSVKFMPLEFHSRISSSRKPSQTFS